MQCVCVRNHSRNQSFIFISYVDGAYEIKPFKNAASTITSLHATKTSIFNFVSATTIPPNKARYIKL